MPEACSFRQVDEKHVSAAVEKMLWSPKMDLIAVANINGEVNLHRLSWQKVWTLSPTCEDDKVTKLAWRPDGKVLAVGYECSKIHLVDVEDATLLHVLNTVSSVSAMAWISHEGVPAEQQGDDNSSSRVDCFQEDSHEFLPKLAPFNRTYSTISKGKELEDNVEDSKKLKDQEEVNLLLVCAESGCLHLYAYGVFPVAVVDLNDHLKHKVINFTSAHISHDLYLLSVVVTVQNGEKRETILMSFDTTLLAVRHRELKLMSLKIGQILTLMAYLESTIVQMTEAWEDILLEMDSKLKKFAEEKKSLNTGSVSNDFLRLLMFGTPSDELTSFLLHELTEKGLKKLGHSIETSYSNIQKLVLKHLHSVGQALIYHLADVKGMSLWYDKFGVLGLHTETVQEALSVAGAFMLKASELQQVIDGSMKNFKAFLRWMYVVIQRLSEEPIPAELTKMTQQDLHFVAQFLKENFGEVDENGEGTTSGFKLEKVGQYLRNENLVDPPDVSNNPWTALLQASPKIQESPLLYEMDTKKSLRYMYALLRDNVTHILGRCACVIGRSLQCVVMHKLFCQDTIMEVSTHEVSQMSKEIDGSAYIYTAFTIAQGACEKCYVTRQFANSSDPASKEIEGVSLQVNHIPASSDLHSSRVSSNCSKHLIANLSFYDAETLSLLLKEDGHDETPVLIQIHLQVLEEYMYRLKLEDGTLVDQPDLVCVDPQEQMDLMNFRRLENMKSAGFAVSGTRKVACVLFSSRRRVRLFLMDAEDEEDEESEDNESDEEETGEQEVPKAGACSSPDRHGDSSRDTTRELMGADDSDENKENTSHESGAGDAS